MHALMTFEDYTPVIVNTESSDFAELAATGYIPIKQGTKKKLQQLYEEMFGEYEMVGELELNTIN